MKKLIYLHDNLQEILFYKPSHIYNYILTNLFSELQYHISQVVLKVGFLTMNHVWGKYTFTKVLDAIFTVLQAVNDSGKIITTQGFEKM